MSLYMMQKNIDLFSDQLKGDHIYKISFDISCDFIHENILRKNALLYINKRLESGIDCVLSSANYKKAVIGFRDALIHTGLINSKYKENIHIIASEIDWKIKNRSYQGNEFNQIDWDYLTQQEENNENAYIS